MVAKVAQTSLVVMARRLAFWLALALSAVPLAAFAADDAPAAAPVPLPAAAAPAQTAPAADKPCETKDCPAKDCEKRKDCCDQACDDGPCDDCGECCAEGPCAECKEAHAKPCDQPCDAEGHGADGGKHPMLHGIRFGKLRARPVALIQTQFVAYTGKDAQLANGDRAQDMGFSMRRARFGLDGGLGRRVDFGIVADFVQGNPLSEAWMGLGAWHNAKLIVGAQKVAFSHFAMVGSGDQALAERPFAVSAMAPFRQVGATLTGKYDLLCAQWFLGAYNGFERNATFFEGIQENAGFNGNHFNGLSYVGRVQLEPLGRLGPAVADHGRKSLRFEVGGGVLYNDGGTTKSLSYSGDVHLKWRGAHLAFEYLRDAAKPQQQPTTASTIPADINRQAIIVEGGYAWWRLNAAVRYELIDPNTANKDNEDQGIVSAALGYQLMRNKLRVQVQYDHRAENKGTPGQAGLENDTVFGQFQFML